MSTRNNTMVSKSHVQTKTIYIVNDDGTKTFGDPLALAENLINDQGNNDKNLKGTCGICAVGNILRLANIAATEQQILDYYLKELRFPHKLFWRALISESASYYSGGSDPKGRMLLLNHFGIDSVLVPSIRINDSYNQVLRSADRIAEYVEQGKGVIVSFDADIYDKERYGLPQKHQAIKTHALVVTSVKRDSLNNLVGLYVHDSNGQSKTNKFANTSSNKGTILLTREQFTRYLSYTKINVTKEAIR